MQGKRPRPAQGDFRPVQGDIQGPVQGQYSPAQVGSGGSHSWARNILLLEIVMNRVLHRAFSDLCRGTLKTCTGPNQACAGGSVGCTRTRDLWDFLFEQACHSALCRGFSALHRGSPKPCTGLFQPCTGVPRRLAGRFRHFV